MSPLLRDRETAYFSNQAGSVLYNSAGYVRLAWSSERLLMPELQSFYEQTLTLLRSTSSNKILSEHGQRQPLPVAAQNWLTENWIPRAIPTGGTLYCAIVEGGNPVHRLSTSSVVAASPEGILFRRFDIGGDAEKWLQKV
jgi:hypothetical protein